MIIDSNIISISVLLRPSFLLSGISLKNHSNFALYFFYLTNYCSVVSHNHRNNQKPHSGMGPSTLTNSQTLAIYTHTNHLASNNSNATSSLIHLNLTPPIYLIIIQIWSSIPLLKRTTIWNIPLYSPCTSFIPNSLRVRLPADPFHLEISISKPNPIIYIYTHTSLHAQHTHKSQHKPTQLISLPIIKDGFFPLYDLGSAWASPLGDYYCRCTTIPKLLLHILPTPPRHRQIRSAFCHF